MMTCEKHGFVPQFVFRTVDEIARSAVASCLHDANQILRLGRSAMHCALEPGSLTTEQRVKSRQALIRINTSVHRTDGRKQTTAAP